MTEYPVPSPTKTITLTETELMALQFPAPAKVVKTRWKAQPGEELREIPKLPGYFMSNQGRLLHRVQRPNGRIVETELKGTVQTGHRFTTVGRNVNIRYERVMLELFKPDKRSNFMFAVPLDGDYLNITTDNFVWMRRKAGTQYLRSLNALPAKTKTKIVKGRRGEYVQRVLYSSADEAEMIRLIKAGIAQYKIAEIFGCSAAHLCRLKKKVDKQNAKKGD